MFDDEIEEKEKADKKKTPKRKSGTNKESRLGTTAGYMPQSYVYGRDYPTCWLHSYKRQVF